MFFFWESEHDWFVFLNVLFWGLIGVMWNIPKLS